MKVYFFDYSMQERRGEGVKISSFLCFMWCDYIDLCNKMLIKYDRENRVNRGMKE